MKRNLLVVPVLLILPFTTGCAGFIADQVMDSATDNIIKLMEAEARINREKRLESYVIEGRFKSLEMMEKEVPVEDPDKIERKRDGNSITIKRPNKTIRTCIITFQDGREMEFRNVPPREMEAGKRYVITYNGLDEITSVAESAPSGSPAPANPATPGTLPAEPQEQD